MLFKRFPTSASSVSHKRAYSHPCSRQQEVGKGVPTNEGSLAEQQQGECP